MAWFNNIFKSKAEKEAEQRAKEEEELRRQKAEEARKRQQAIDTFNKRELDEEEKLLTSIESAIMTAEQMERDAADELKPFYKSFMKCHRANEISGYFYKKTPSDGDCHKHILSSVFGLDPLFEEVKEFVIQTQNASTSNVQRHFSLGYNRSGRILDELEKMGVVSSAIGSMPRKVLVAANSKSITNEEIPFTSEELSRRYEQRKKELLTNECVFQTIYMEEDNGTVSAYKQLSEAYNKLCSCGMRWQVMSTKDNTKYKSIIQQVIDRRIMIMMQPDKLCYSSPTNDCVYPVGFHLEEGNSLYIYPDIAIVANSYGKFSILDDLTVIPLNKLNITFAIRHFVENNPIEQKNVPQDAKFIGNTYKYTNKNGQPDTRYKDNPQYPVYEYGELWIEPLGVTIMFSDVEATKAFHLEFEKYKAMIASESVKIAEEKWQEEETTAEDSHRNSKHNVGDKHPTKPWIWTEYKPGKFDWRVDKSHSSVDNKAPENRTDDKTALAKLSKLIGLRKVKDEVEALANYVKVQKMREEQGLKTSALSYHCVFTGNPGTGKTTVARIVAEIYKELGILKKGHLVETDRAGLVAEYVGQTAVKTNKIIDEALDGVLFIDEAYSLVVKDSPNDFGMEAISTLLKRMEDDRNRLVVVLAGYGDEMKTFIDSNPGLQSRFTRYIHFDDYNAEELLSIFTSNIEQSDYVLDDTAKDKVTTVFENAVAHKDKNFGNGRFVRNVFEKTLQNQASRIAKMDAITKEVLTQITADDVCENV